MPTNWSTSSKQHTIRYPSQSRQDRDSSPPSSELSFDDDCIEYARGIAPQARYGYRQNTSIKNGNKKIDRGRDRSCTNLDRDKTLTSLDTLLPNKTRRKKSKRLYSPLFNAFNENFVTTMNEDDQQVFIALFFWKMKVSRAHFKAWKWVVFSLRPSLSQTHSQGSMKGPRKSNLYPPRRNLILKRHTDSSSAEEVAKDHSRVNIGRLSPLAKLHVDKLDSSSIDRKASLNSNHDSKGAHFTEIRRQLKMDLRLAYFCFSQWKINSDTCRQRSVHQLVRADRFHNKKRLTTFMRLWRDGTQYLQQRRQSLSDANTFHQKRVKRTTLYRLQYHCRHNQELVRRQEIHAIQQRRFVFQRWRRCFRQTQRCRCFVAKWRRNHLQLVLKRFQRGFDRAKQDRLQFNDAVFHHEKYIQTLTFQRWRKATFEDRMYLLSVTYSTRISLSSGVRKWRRFLTDHRVKFQEVVLADYFQYRNAVQWAFQEWQRFLSMKQRCKRIFARLRGSHEQYIQVHSIHKLQAFAHATQILRRQGKMANEKYQLQIIARTFHSWTRSARKSAALSKFGQNVNARKLAKVFLDWQKQTTARHSLRAKHCIVAKRWRDRILKQVIQKWLRRLRIQVFETIRARRQQTLTVVLHFSAWQAWSTKNRFWRKSVKQQRLRSDRNLLQQVLRQWSGGILRKRCLRRLGKLFRKKQTRQRKRLIFRLWRVQMHVCVATRKQDRDRARLSLAGWKQICRNRTEKKSTMAMVGHYYRRRRYALAIKVWSSFAKRTLGFRRAERKARSIYFRRLLIKTLRYWGIAATTCRRRVDVLVYRQQLRDEKKLHHSLQAWHSLVQRQRERRRQYQIAIDFQRIGRQRRLFFAWLEGMQVYRMLTEKRWLAVDWHTKGLQEKVFHAWRGFTQRSSQRQRTWWLIQETMKQKRLRSCVTRWSSFCLKCQHGRKQYARAETFYNEYLMYLVMHRWQIMWCQISTLHHKEMMAIKQMIAHRLASVVIQWHDACQHSLRARAKRTKAYHFFMKKVLFKHLERWKSHTAKSLKTVYKQRFIPRLWKQRLLFRMFQRWQQHFEMSLMHRELKTKAKQFRSKSVLGLAFQKWKRYRSKRTQSVLACIFHQRRLLRKSWLGWKVYCKVITAVRRNVLVTSQLKRTNLFQATFARWKTLALHHQQARARFQRADTYLIRWQCHRAVFCWKKLATYQQSVVKAANAGRRIKMQYVWKQWRRYIALKINQRTRRVLAKQHRDQNQTTRYFCAWKTLAKRNVQARNAKSAALNRGLYLKRVWSRWILAVQWRRRFSGVEKLRRDKFRAKIFKAWNGHGASRIVRRRAIEKFVAVQKKRRRTNAWRSWKRNVEICRERQYRLKWALSYYHVEILLRRAYRAWKKLLATQSAHRVNEKRAVALHTQQLSRAVYQRWGEYIGIKRRHLARAEALLYQIKGLSMSRSVQKWRQQTLRAHQRHQIERFAARMYSRRRLTRALKQLKMWRTLQFHDRELTIQAQGFRDNRAMATCFQHWQRGHQWRVKCTTLIRGFARNKRRKIFLQWITYWQQRRLKDEKRLQARVFRCVFVEQRVLLTWRSVVRVREQKQAARAFHTAKLNRRTFSIWRSRTQVLQRLKKMVQNQNVLRLQLHLDAWRQFIAATREMEEKVAVAMHLKTNQCMWKVWQSWSTWVSLKQQKQLASDFRKRSLTRKIVAVWRGRVARWQRKRALTDHVLLQWRKALLCQSFHHLQQWKQVRKKLTQLQDKISTRANARYKRRVIANLRALSLKNDRERRLITHACEHWKLRHQQKYWTRVVQWFDLVQSCKSQRRKATMFAHTHLLRHCIDALQRYNLHSKQEKDKIHSFRWRYSLKVVGTCFHQWKKFLALRCKFRALRSRSLLSHRRKRLLQWRHQVAALVHRRCRLYQIAQKRRRRERLAWFNHWESVCTDQWLEKQLVAYHQRHAQQHRRLWGAIQRLKVHVAARHTRQKHTSFYIKHHKPFLTHVLHHWHDVTRMWS